MKLNLECGNDVRNGYMNINSEAIHGVEEDLIVADFRNLDTFVEDESVEEIISNDAVTKLHPAETLRVIEHWSNKLKKGGILEMTYADARSVAREAHIYNISLEEMHSYLLGPSNEKKGLIDVDTCKKLVQSFGLVIDQISYNGCIVHIRVIKP